MAIMADTTLDLNDFGTKQAKVLMDYEAVSAQEITVKQDDVSYYAYVY